MSVHPNESEALRDRLKGMAEAERKAALTSIYNGEGDPTAPPKAVPKVAPAWPAPIGGEALRGLAGDVARAIEPHTEADPNAVLIQFLVAFGNLVGRGPWMLVDGHFHHVNEYCCIVGESSKARKGTSWRRVKAVLTAADASWSSERVKSGLSSGEGLIWHVRDAVPGFDKDGGAIIVDPGVKDKRLLAVESEFGGLIEKMGREGNTLSAVLRDGWDDGGLSTLTKSNPNATTVSHVSVIGHVTMEELKLKLSACDAVNGFANRFAWFVARRSKLLPRGGRSTKREEVELGARVAALASGIGDSEEIRWSAKGGEAWDAAYADLSTSAPGLLGKVTDRSEAHVLRLAMIYCLLDGRRLIEPSHVAAALEVWRYSAESAKLIFGESTGNRDADRALAELVAAGPDGMTRTEVNAAVFKRNKTAAELDAIMAVLIDAKLAEAETVQTSGRPETRYRATK